MSRETTVRARRSSQGFTLIEMLAVLAIIAIAAGITVAAFNGINRGTKMDASVTTLRSTLSMARQWAITHNEKTYVVFPPAMPPLYRGANTNHADKAMRSYNVYTESDGYVNTWNYLPDGIVFVANNAWFPKASNTTVFTQPVLVKWPDSQSPTTSRLPGLTFRSDGSLGSGSEIEIYLGEGTIDYNIATGDVSPPDYRPAAESALMGLEVTPFTGAIRVRDYRDVP